MPAHPESDARPSDDASLNETGESDEIELAYLRALNAIAAVEQDLARAGDREVMQPVQDEAADPAEPGIPVESATPPCTAPDEGGAGGTASSAATGKTHPSADGTALSNRIEEHGHPNETAAAHPEGVTPKQIIEAALFVGGAPLTTKKLCSLFQGEFETDFIERCIDAMNEQYRQENRPYEILFGEGGYRMRLRPEFESVNNRVYGYGPKEVRLSQEALEVLALVAYQQPVTKQQIEQWDKPNAGTILRQLLRRQVVALERGNSGPDDVRYITTKRFLSLFGLGTLDNLPHPEDLELK